MHMAIYIRLLHLYLCVFIFFQKKIDIEKLNMKLSKIYSFQETLL